MEVIRSISRRYSIKEIKVIEIERVNDQDLMK